MSEGPSPAAASTVDPVRAGRDALARRDWSAAFELLAEADRTGGLSGDDLEQLAVAAFFAAHGAEGVAAKERAFKAHLIAGNEIRAGYIALDVGTSYAYEGRQSIAASWLRRAEKLLGRGDTYAHGYLALARSEMAAAAGDTEAALRLAEEAVAIGDRTEDQDLRAFSLSTLGTLKIATGETDDGLALMEEASLAAVNGDLSPMASGITACRMIAACRDLTDYRRATEWIEATERYCERQSVGGFPGVCRIHRAEVAAVGGAWDKAEADLVRATTELVDYQATPPQADGYYAIGEIRRLKGDLSGAESALRDAHVRGHSPQPALALVRLAEGKVKAAATAINAAVAETNDRWARGRLLVAQVEISIAAGDVGRARTAVDELETIIAGHPSPALVAGRQAALGRVLLAEGDAAHAAAELRLAIRGWREVGAPYEVARARALLAQALRATDEEDDADLELRAAHDEFERLGARLDADATAREIRDVEDRRSGPLQVRKTFMFTDIVGSTTIAEALGDQAWERLLRWHDDEIRALVAQSGGEVVKATGDGFFVAFDTPRAGIDCAVAIQRALQVQREATGFALAVRIGLHAAEANMRASDYSGMGVNVAARIASLAGGGEIIVSAASLEGIDDIPTEESREAEIRGVSAPVAIARVAWH